MSEARVDDAELLRLARRDSDAFATFYRLHADWVYRWLLPQVGDPHTATDLTAETFAQALVSLKRFRGREAGSGTAWIFGIARNLLRRYFVTRVVDTQARERLAIERRAYVADEYEETEERIDAQTLAAEIEDALGGLSPALRETLELRAVDELGYAEIAERTGISEANARMRVTRALRTAGARLTAPKKELL